MASISVRTSICWADGPREEPTSTLVLTSPGRRFVDIRIRWAEAAAATTPPAARTAATAHFAGLDWAFAGASTMTPLPAEEGAAGATAGAWRHWIDSRHAVAGAVVDEGVCYAQPDGTMREVGTMAHPATGVPTPYEEVWLDPAPEATGAGTRPRCVVLQLGGEPATETAAAATAAGMVVRLGRLCQGVVRHPGPGDGHFAAERWQWTADGGGWKCVFRHGMGDLPIGAMLAADGDDSLCAGAHVADAAGHAWTVVEAEALEDSI